MTGHFNHAVCDHCGKPVEQWESRYGKDEWFHPSQVTSDNGGQMCRDGKHAAEPKQETYVRG